jgi:hypothetical protein
MWPWWAGKASRNVLPDSSPSVCGRAAWPSGGLQGCAVLLKNPFVEWLLKTAVGGFQRGSSRSFPPGASIYDLAARRAAQQPRTVTGGDHGR